jgi:SAM-dependent methyltransferase
MYDGIDKYDEQVARNYDSDREKEAHWHEENKFIEAYFAGYSSGPILDIPVGTGRFLPIYPRSMEVCGVDVSQQMLNMAELRVSGERLSNVRLVQGSIFSMAFADRHFSTSVCWRLAHLLPEGLLIDGLKELRRITAGEILLQAYVKGPLYRRLLGRFKNLPGNLWRRLRYGRPGGTPWSHIKAEFHSAETFAAAFAAAGLAVTKSVKLCDYGSHDVYVYILRANR